MTTDEFRKFCAGFKGSRETFPFDEVTLVVKVGPRMYALAGIDTPRLSVNLKCDPELSLELRSSYPGVIVPGWHMNKEHWITVHAEGFPDDKLAWLIRLSYDLVAEKLTARERTETGLGPKPPRLAHP